MALRVWLPLNGNLENKGLSTIIPSGTPTFLDNGKIGKCISLTPRVSFTGMPRMDNFTVLFWLKVDSCSVDWADSLSFTSIQADGSSAAPFRFEATKTSRACSFHNNTPYAITTGSRILITEAQKGEWHHCGFSYDGEHCYTYIDGVLTYTDTGLGGYVNNYFHIGETNNMVGGMNDLRVYDECLSQKQIKEISKGLAAHYKLEGPGASLNLLKNTNINSGDNNYWQSYSTFDETTRTLTRSTTATTESFITHRINGLKSNQTYTLSFYAKSNGYVSSMETFCFNASVQGIRNKNHGKPTSDFTKYTWTFTTASDVDYSTNAQIRFDNNGSTQSGTEAILYIKEVKLEEGDKATPWIPNVQDSLYNVLGYNNMIPRDSSGNGYNGKITGTLSYNPDSIRYSGCTKFNSGFLNYLPSPINTSTDAFTFTCWFYPTQNATMALYNDRTAVGDGFSVFYLGGGIRFDTGASSQAQSGTITVNAWNFVACVFDKNNNIKKIYINGSQVGSTSTIGSLSAVGTYASIGASSVNDGGGGNQMYGSISDVRIYSTALSADEILTMYKNSGIIDNKGNVYAYEFKEE